jgi:electron transfer flavoprotein-quinone oxidoreductase
LKDSYDVIVVGAGPAGSAAAYIMAQKGLDVCLMERGDYPGSKNMFGGAIYRRSTEIVFPEFWKEAPIERILTEDMVWFLDDDSAVKMGFNGQRFAKSPYNKFSALRTNFDRWLAKKAVEKGTHLEVKALVSDLFYKKSGFNRRQINGVIMEDGSKVKADAVIIAEGASAFLTKKAGLRSEIPARTVTLYVKEVLSLDSGKINDRFQLEENEGTNIAFVGYPTVGIIGKGGLWTNKESISITVGGYLNQMVERKLSPFHLLQRFKAHPLLKKMLQGAKPVEYMSKITPKGGYTFMPTLYDSGLLVAGDAGVMVSGRRGTDLAMISGMHAGETIVQAKAKGSFSKGIMSAYMTKLNDTFFMKNIKSSRGHLDYFGNHVDADYLLNSFINEIAYEYFTEDNSTAPERTERIIRIIKRKQKPLKTIKDLIAGIKDWGIL